jgi:apolipoprotein N-acyltransferase
MKLNKNNLNGLLLAGFSALLLTVASPGFDYGFIAWFALVPLFFAVGKKLLKPVYAGLVFGWIYYFFGISWLSYPLTDIGNAPLFITWIVTGIFALYLALYYGLTMWLFAHSRGSLVYVPLFFAASEFFRAIFLTGFPWLTLAQTQYLYPEILTINAFLGEHGLSLLIVLSNLLIYHGLKSKNYVRLALGSLLPVALFYLGAVTPDYEDEGLIKSRMIQTGIGQEEKWDQERVERVVNTVQRKLLDSEHKNYDLVVMPETAYPVFVQDDPILNFTLSAIGDETPLLTGVMRHEVINDRREFFNSAKLYAGDNSSTYDKVHLVPFGEYFPFAGLLKPIDDYFFHGAQDYAKGTDFSIFNLGKMRIAPLICYEGAFYKQLKAQTEKGANLVVLVSNDSWFGFSHGRYQHLAVDVMRSAEFGRWILRCTQSGISAYIDDRGRVVSTLGVSESGYLDHQAELISQRTFFSRFGYIWLALVALCVFGYTAVTHMRGYKKH